MCFLILLLSLPIDSEDSSVSGKESKVEGLMNQIKTFLNAAILLNVCVV